MKFRTILLALAICLFVTGSALAFAHLCSQQKSAFNQKLGHLRLNFQQLQLSTLRFERGVTADQKSNPGAINVRNAVHINELLNESFLLVVHLINESEKGIESTNKNRRNEKSAEANHTAFF